MTALLFCALTTDVSSQGADPRRASYHRGVDTGRVIRKNTDVVASVCTPTTSDEINLFHQCWSRARADKETEDEAYSEAAFQYNLAVARNGEIAGERNPKTRVLNLLGSVTTVGLRKYWQEKSRYASRSLGVGGGGGTHGGRGPERGGVLVVSDADIDAMGKNALMKQIRKYEGGTASSSLEPPELRRRLKKLVREGAPLK